MRKVKIAESPMVETRESISAKLLIRRSLPLGTCKYLSNRRTPKTVSGTIQTKTAVNFDAVANPTSTPIKKTLGRVPLQKGGALADGNDLKR